MLLIQRLVLISARAHRCMRLVALLISSATCAFTFSSLAVHIRLPARPVFRSYYSGSKPSVVRAWMRTTRTPYGTPHTLPRLLGSLFNCCEFSRVLFQGFIRYGGYRWSYGANKIQIHTNVKLLSEFLSCLTNDVGRDYPSLPSLSPSPPPRMLTFASKFIGLIKHIERETQSMAQVLRLLAENEILWTYASGARLSPSPVRGSEINTLCATPSFVMPRHR